MILELPKKKLNYNVTKHGIITGIYFINIIENIYKLIDFQKTVSVLDFGCGYGYLKRKFKKYKKIKVINFDIVDEFTEIKDWKKVKFDYLISTHVFYLFTKKKLNKLLLDLKKHNPKLKLIVIISKQGLLNNLGKILFNELDAHKGTVFNPNQEFSVLMKHMKIIKKKNILLLSDVYLLEFL